MSLNPAQLNKLVKAYLRGMHCRICRSKLIAYWPIYNAWYCYTCGSWFKG